MLGTPTTDTTTSLSHYHHYHSTPNTLFSTPSQSLLPQGSSSSPSSLRSLPSRTNESYSTASYFFRRTKASADGTSNRQGFSGSRNILNNSQPISQNNQLESTSFTFDKFRRHFGLPSSKSSRNVGEILCSDSNNSKFSAENTGERRQSLSGHMFRNPSSHRVGETETDSASSNHCVDETENNSSIRHDISLQFTSSKYSNSGPASAGSVSGNMQPVRNPIHIPPLML